MPTFEAFARYLAEEFVDWPTVYAHESELWAIWCSCLSGVGTQSDWPRHDPYKCALGFFKTKGILTTEHQ